VIIMYQISLRPRPFPEHWRNLAEYWRISSGAKQRLEWMIFYHTVGAKSSTKTASYFGISRKTFHQWRKRFDPHRIQSLEEYSRAPKQRRGWMVTPQEEQRIKTLRLRYMKYGKKKLKILYTQEYHENISTWKIERVVRKHHLYPDPVSHNKQVWRREKQNRKPKKRIHDLLKEGYAGTLWHTDTITIWWYGMRRVIFTALEDKTKIGYARVYQTNSSRKATDFLNRLIYLSQGDLAIIHSDNGSEFAGEFEEACTELGIQHVYSRARTPKDNPALERFNWTVQDEWLSLSEVGLDEIGEANTDLTNWLIEYNSHRPHEALDYRTPLAYAFEEKVLPMTPASTII